MPMCFDILFFFSPANCLERNKTEKLWSGILIRNVIRLFYGTSDFCFSFLFQNWLAAGLLAWALGQSAAAPGAWCSGTADSFGSKPAAGQDSGS